MTGVESNRDEVRGSKAGTHQKEFTFCTISIRFPLLRHLLLISLSLFFCLLTLLPNSGWPGSLPHLPGVAREFPREMPTAPSLTLAPGLTFALLT